MINQLFFDCVKSKGLGLALALLLASISFSQQVESLRFSTPLELPVVEKTSLASLTLDNRIYNAGSKGLTDLRIVDSHNKLVSFVVRQQTTQREEQTITNHSIGSPELKFLGENGLEISFSIAPEKSPGPLRRILIRTGLREFERRANLEWDQGKGEWIKLASDVLLYDYSSVIDLRNLEIRLPQPLELRQLSKFRLTIDKVTEAQESQVVELTRRLRGANEEYREERLLVNRQPFRIEGLESKHETKRIVSDSPLKTNYSTKIVSQKEMKEEGCTVLIVESLSEPLTSFQLQTADDNFSRQVTIEKELVNQETEKHEYQPVGQGRVSKIHLPGTELEQLEIGFPETSSQVYRLTIHNDESQPLRISSVTASGNTYQLFFLARPGEQYRLEYGGGEMAPPKFDTVAISTAVDKRIASIPAKLGEAAKLEGIRVQPAAEWKLPIWVYWLCALVLVALLASSLYSAAKRVDATE